MQPPLVRLKRACASLAAFCLAAIAWSVCAHAADERTLSFYNIHTKEKATITFKRDGEFLPEGLKEINHIMRDWRRNEPTDMDRELIDTIWEIYQDVGSKEPIHLVSGYRSKKTNESLRRRRGGQARKSQHILGKAADLHFPDVPVKRLRNSALVRQVGGVGYYPKSGLPFVHVDTGRVRHWPRIPRQELAAIFPDGKTQHVPSDGRPLTPRDGAIALAKMDKKIDSFIEKKSKIKVPKKIVMAGFTPPSLGWGKGKEKETAVDPVTTASLPPESRTPEPREQAKRTASLAPSDTAPAAKPVRLKAPGPQPRIALAPIDDVEHPEEFVYGVPGVDELISEYAVIADRNLATLVAPGADDEHYLLREPEEVFSGALATGLGYTHKVATVAFGAREMAPRPIVTASRQ